jgi:CxxC motif-containing protein (DUF1111 family)
MHARVPTRGVLIALCAACAAGLAPVSAATIDSSTADRVPLWLTTQSGGAATLAITNENAYARPIEAMPVEKLRDFTFGNRIFNTNWVAAPASVDGFDGLGPVFNRVSCSGCHTRDGRGHPPDPGQPLESMLVRLSVPGTDGHGGPRPVPRYGDQLNEKAISGVPAEGRTLVSYTERTGTHADGTAYALAMPAY